MFPFDHALGSTNHIQKYKVQQAPCYLHFCPFGSTCRVNSSTNEPVCVCEQKCPAVLAPLCGSDGATYNNPCLMERASCQRGKKIKVASNGPCGKSNRHLSAIRIY
ncbi:agrin [Biomphalaria glabrata]|nr:agrin [Biomphalaria glabrata]